MSELTTSFHDATVTRSAWGYPIRHEGLAICDDGEMRTVEWGVADTFFTCPARQPSRRGPSHYGYVTQEDGVTRFHLLDNQDEAKARYRASIQF